MKKNALLNVIKQVCSILFPLITFPYAVRILGVENYGKINFGNSIISYFGMLAALGLHNYAIREGTLIRHDKNRFSHLANQLFTVNCITSAIAYLLLLLCIFTVKELQSKRVLLCVQSILIPLSALGCEWINIVYEDYKYITIRYIVLQFISVVMMFLFVHAPSDYILYAAIMLISQAGASIVNIFYIRKKYVSLKLLRKNVAFTKHIRALILLFGVTLASFIYLDADTTMIGLFRNDTEVGLYSAAARIYNLVKMVINAIVAVTIPRLSALCGEQNTREYNKILNDVVCAVGMLMLPCIAGIFSLSEIILDVICGAEYIDAYISLRVLALSMLFAVAAYICSSGVLMPNKKDKQFLYITVIGALVNLLLNMIVIPLMGYVGAAITTLISELLVFVFSYKAARKFVNKLTNAKCFFEATLGTLGIVVICELYKHSGATGLFGLALCILLSILAYVLILVLIGNQYAIAAVQILRLTFKKQIQ